MLSVLENFLQGLVQSAPSPLTSSGTYHGSDCVTFAVGIHVCGQVITMRWAVGTDSLGSGVAADCWGLGCEGLVMDGGCEWAECGFLVVAGWVQMRGCGLLGTELGTEYVYTLLHYYASLLSTATTTLGSHHPHHPRHSLFAPQARSSGSLRSPQQKIKRRRSCNAGKERRDGPITGK